MSDIGQLRGPTRWETVTPADAVFSAAVLGGEKFARAFYQETTGAVSFYDPQGNVFTLPGLLGGVIHSIPHKGVRDTGTDATTTYSGF